VILTAHQPLVCVILTAHQPLVCVILTAHQPLVCVILTMHRPVGLPPAGSSELSVFNASCCRF
ncbi:MAG: hypothetical protein II940_02045, partial [Methanosarcinaceae archaeon]|nr:hypothetical protein [Methanosarcinaceae archaeon]